MGFIRALWAANRAANRIGRSADRAADKYLQPVFWGAVRVTKGLENILARKKDTWKMYSTDAEIHEKHPDYKGSIYKTHKKLKKISHGDINLFQNDIMCIAKKHQLVEIGLLPAEQIASDYRMIQHLINQGIYRNNAPISKETWEELKEESISTEAWEELQKELKKVSISKETWERLGQYTQNISKKVWDKLDENAQKETFEILNFLPIKEEEIAENYRTYKRISQEAYEDVFDMLHNNKHYQFGHSDLIQSALEKTESTNCDALKENHPDEYETLCSELYRERCHKRKNYTERDKAKEIFNCLTYSNGAEEEKGEIAEREEKTADIPQNDNAAFEEWRDSDSGQYLEGIRSQDVEQCRIALQEEWRDIRDIQDDIMCFIEQHPKKWNEAVRQEICQYPHARKIIFAQALQDKKSGQTASPATAPREENSDALDQMEAQATSSVTEEKTDMVGKIIENINQFEQIKQAVKEGLSEIFEDVIERNSTIQQAIQAKAQKWNDLTAAQKEAFHGWLGQRSPQEQNIFIDRIMKSKDPISIEIAKIIREGNRTDPDET